MLKCYIGLMAAGAAVQAQTAAAGYLSPDEDQVDLVAAYQAGYEELGPPASIAYCIEDHLGHTGEQVVVMEM